MKSVMNVSLPGLNRSYVIIYIFMKNVSSASKITPKILFLEPDSFTSMGSQTLQYITRLDSAIISLQIYGIKRGQKVSTSLSYPIRSMILKIETIPYAVSKEASMQQKSGLRQFFGIPCPANALKLLRISIAMETTIQKAKVNCCDDEINHQSPWYSGSHVA